MDEISEIQPDSPEQAEGEVVRPPFLFLPGLFGGGDALTEIREEILKQLRERSVFLPSSISTRKRAGFQDKNIEGWINSAAKMGSGVIVAHSLGVAELEYLLRHLKEKGDIPPNLKIILISPLGASETSRGLRVIPTVVDIHKNVGFYDQHTVYPLPDSFYQEDKDEDKDIEPDRAARRKRFLNLFGERSVKYKGKEMPLKDALAQIDRELEQSSASQPPERLLRERGALLAPFIQELYEGRHIQEEGHRKVQEKFDSEISRLGLLAQGLRFLPQVLRSALSGKNIIERLADLAEGVQIYLFALKNDLFLNPEQAEKLKEQLKEQLKAKGINIFVHKVPVYAHSSFAYQPETFVKKLKEVLGQNEEEKT